MLIREISYFLKYRYRDEPWWFTIIGLGLWALTMLWLGVFLLVIWVLDPGETFRYIGGVACVPGATLGAAFGVAGIRAWLREHSEEMQYDLAHGYYP